MHKCPQGMSAAFTGRSKHTVQSPSSASDLLPLLVNFDAPGFGFTSFVAVFCVFCTGLVSLSFIRDALGLGLTSIVVNCDDLVIGLASLSVKFDVLGLGSILLPDVCFGCADFEPSDLILFSVTVKGANNE